MGVAEHIFDVNIHGKSVTWHLFDVGGARGQRHSWVPYFDDANAIIFVAPVSAFDQVGLHSFPFAPAQLASYFYFAPLIFIPHQIPILIRIPGFSTWKKTPGQIALMTLFSCLLRYVQMRYSKASISCFSSVRHLLFF